MRPFQLTEEEKTRFSSSVEQPKINELIFLFICAFYRLGNVIKFNINAGRRCGPFYDGWKTYASRSSPKCR